MQHSKNFENLEPQNTSGQIEGILDSINFEVEETQVSVEDREVSTEEIWGEIAGKTIKGRSKETKVTIPNLLKLTLEDLKKGKIIETEKPLRKYLNKIFEIELIDIEINTYSLKEEIARAKKAIKRI